MKKYSLLYIKKHKECNASITLGYSKMPYPTKITNEKKSDHNFLYPSDRQHINVPVKIVSLIVNAFSTEISLIFYCLFQIVINLFLNHVTFSGRSSKSVLYLTVKTVHSIHVGQKFEDYKAFESAIERYQSAKSVQFYKRDSRTVQKAKPSYKKKKEKKRNGRAVDRTSDLLFSSPVHY